MKESFNSTFARYLVFWTALLALLYGRLEPLAAESRWVLMNTSALRGWP
jgi:hypothetical protein